MIEYFYLLSGFYCKNDVLIIMVPGEEHGAVMHDVPNSHKFAEGKGLSWCPGRDSNSHNLAITGF